MEFLGNMVELSTTGLFGSLFKLLGTVGVWAEAASKIVGLIKF